MIDNDERLIVYLKSLVNSIYKILPLYEESNTGLRIYVESLLFELYGLGKVVPISDSYDYLSLLSNLESLKYQVGLDEDKKATVKREVFKCINIIKNMTHNLEEGE